MERAVIWPEVLVFKEVTKGRAQALKVLEEAAEVFAEAQKLDNGETADHTTLVDECCDVVQAISNLLAAYGETNMDDAMYRCYRRNKARGRM